jgi:hypothetical protein
MLWRVTADGSALTPAPLPEGEGISVGMREMIRVREYESGCALFQHLEHLAMDDAVGGYYAVVVD